MKEYTNPFPFLPKPSQHTYTVADIRRAANPVAQNFTDTRHET